MKNQHRIAILREIKAEWNTYAGPIVKDLNSYGMRHSATKPEQGILT
ncbi:MAG: hypothetical protein OEV74_07785 [Cyclobacteriaceae bacterium]|nr:hypothetical protein [Cyclobacteriaceae bacterium]MDH4296160.1 hypothetical protein [Cyclobacteriaceae bacterium]MDH5249753.1 hypothetical protein [Cyclobacteriaceae bacterium]